MPSELLRSDSTGSVPAETGPAVVLADPGDVRVGGGTSHAITLSSATLDSGAFERTAALWYTNAAVERDFTAFLHRTRKPLFIVAVVELVLTLLFLAIAKKDQRMLVAQLCKLGVSALVIAVAALVSDRCTVWLRSVRGYRGWLPSRQQRALIHEAAFVGLLFTSMWMVLGESADQSVVVCPPVSPAPPASPGAASAIDDAVPRVCHTAGFSDTMKTAVLCFFVPCRLVRLVPALLVLGAVMSGLSVSNVFGIGQEGYFNVDDGEKATRILMVWFEMVSVLILVRPLVARQREHFEVVVESARAVAARRATLQQLRALRETVAAVEPGSAAGSSVARCAVVSAPFTPKLLQCGFVATLLVRVDARVASSAKKDGAVYTPTQSAAASDDDVSAGEESSSVAERNVCALRTAATRFAAMQLIVPVIQRHDTLLRGAVLGDTVAVVSCLVPDDDTDTAATDDAVHACVARVADAALRIEAAVAAAAQGVAGWRCVAWRAVVTFGAAQQEVGADTRLESCSGAVAAARDLLDRPDVCFAGQVHVAPPALAVLAADTAFDLPPHPCGGASLMSRRSAQSSLTDVDTHHHGGLRDDVASGELATELSADTADPPSAATSVATRGFVQHVARLDLQCAMTSWWGSDRHRGSGPATLLFPRFVDPAVEDAFVRDDNSRIRPTIGALGVFVAWCAVVIAGLSLRPGTVAAPVVACTVTFAVGIGAAVYLHMRAPAITLVRRLGLVLGLEFTLAACVSTLMVLAPESRVADQVFLVSAAAAFAIALPLPEHPPVLRVVTLLFVATSVSFLGAMFLPPGRESLQRAAPFGFVWLALLLVVVTHLRRQQFVDSRFLEAMRAEAADAHAATHAALHRYVPDACVLRLRDLPTRDTDVPLDFDAAVVAAIEPNPHLVVGFAQSAAMDVDRTSGGGADPHTRTAAVLAFIIEELRMALPAAYVTLHGNTIYAVLLEHRGCHEDDDDESLTADAAARASDTPGDAQAGRASPHHTTDMELAPVTETHAAAQPRTRKTAKWFGRTITHAVCLTAAGAAANIAMLAHAGGNTTARRSDGSLPTAEHAPRFPAGSRAIARAALTRGPVVAGLLGSRPRTFGVVGPALDKARRMVATTAAEGNVLVAASFDWQLPPTVSVAGVGVCSAVPLGG